ncbi:MAG: hypothetical protein AB7J35_16480 [Dehalococcoidia bacterium]
MNVWSVRIAAVAIALVAVVAAAPGFPAKALTPTPSNTPESTVTPPPAGTPWPAPLGLSLTLTAILLDDQNFPLPPDRQIHTARLTWEVLPGFTGTFEIQRAPRPLGGAEPGWAGVHASVAASTAVEGIAAFEEQIGTFDLFCYRVRTVINGETGPYSQAECMVRAPSGVEHLATPVPPDLGNAEAGASSGRWFAAVPAAFALVILVLGLQLLFSQRRSIPPR